MLSNCRARRGNPPFLPFFDDCNVINSDNRNEITVPFGDDPSPLRHRVPALYLIVECRPWPLLEIARRTADKDEACDPLVRAAESVADGIRIGGPAGEPAAHKPHRMRRSEEHTSELQSLMRISYAVFCLKKKQIKIQ